MRNTYPKYPLSTPDAKNFATSARPAADAFTPADIYSAYCFPKDGEAAPGRGIKIAVIDAFSNSSIADDFNTFGKNFSLPPNTLNVHYMNQSRDVYNKGWVIESAADTQWAYASAPNAEITCVFAENASVEALFRAVKYAADNGADVVSMSWGSGEFQGQAEYTSLMKSYPNTVFVASAGDVGGEVFFPSSSDAVVSVGGTALRINSRGVVTNRSAWENGGGGPSKYTGIPDWQNKFSPINSLANGYRATPDVALEASPKPGYTVYTSNEGGYISVGGTSISAPVFSGICARILQRNPNFWQSNSSINEYLYKAAGETSYEKPQYCFSDITVGSNGKYFATVGYDLATGLGAPKACQLIGGCVV